MQMLFNMTEEYILIFGEAHWEERQKILLENVTLRVGHRRLPVTPMILIQGQLEKNIEFLLKLYLCSVFSPPCLYCDEISDAYSWLKGCDMTFFSRSFIEGHGQSD